MRVNEIFKSIQGETSYAGIPTVFIRTTGCNLRCRWCDTAYAYEEGREMSIEKILREVEDRHTTHVVLTGGEPLLQKESPLLMECLLARGYTLLLETGGSLSVEHLDPRVVRILDVKCPGSGMAGQMHWANLDILTARDEVKFVLQDREDYAWAKGILEAHPRLRQSALLFSPVHGALDPALLAHWILEDNLPVRLQLQIHKIIWSPETRGV